MSEMEPKQVIAINENTPRGEKTVAVAIDYGAEIDASSLELTTYSVAKRQITEVSIVREAAGEKGCFVYIKLDSDTDAALTRKMIGFGPNTATKVTGPNISVKQCKKIKTKDGRDIPGWMLGKKHTKSVNSIADQFKAKTFFDADGQKLNYHLFCPIDTDKKVPLPLVVFMHDSSVCSKDVIAPLIQGMGGIIWTEPREQKIRPAYVLVPQYERKTAFDNFTVSEECGRTVELIYSLINDPGLNIDPDRIYGTGQSMGGMMLFEMNAIYPELFAANYYVACQWDPAKVAKMKDQNMWIHISEKDEKAFPVNTQGLQFIEDAGGKVARGHLNAKASSDEKEHFAEEIISQNANIQFTYYDGESVLPPGLKPFPGCYHLCTWSYAYDIEPIRRWLFQQKKGRTIEKEENKK